MPSPLPESSAGLLPYIHLPLVSLLMSAPYTQILLFLFVPYSPRNENVFELSLQLIRVNFSVVILAAHT